MTIISKEGYRIGFEAKDDCTPLDYILIVIKKNKLPWIVPIGFKELLYKEDEKIHKDIYNTCSLHGVYLKDLIESN